MPAVIPVTKPLASMVALPLLALQLPVPVASLSVVVEPASHTDVVPVIGAGIAFTVRS